ncbi:MAG: alpha/beta hydrolase [Actinomycetia bacterium]|nr:alpha/beta hydrolase [Actinomycetes bacterium]
MVSSSTSRLSGTVCLATALKAKQEGWIDQIAGVYSCCPYISGTFSPPPPELTSQHENKDYVIGAEMAQALVKAYDPTGEHAANPLAWPYHATIEELAGLPPHTISVNELDPCAMRGSSTHAS